MKIVKYILILFCLLLSLPADAQRKSTRPNIVGPLGVEANSYTGSLFLNRQGLGNPGAGTFDGYFLFLQQH